MIFRQRPNNCQGGYRLLFVVWSERYLDGKDIKSVGGWGRNPDSLVGRSSFKLEIVK